MGHQEKGNNISPYLISSSYQAISGKGNYQHSDCDQLGPFGQFYGRPSSKHLNWNILLKFISLLLNLRVRFFGNQAIPTWSSHRRLQQPCYPAEAPAPSLLTFPARCSGWGRTPPSSPPPPPHATCRGGRTDASSQAVIRSVKLWSC